MIGKMQVHEHLWCGTTREKHLVKLIVQIEVSAKWS